MKLFSRAAIVILVILLATTTAFAKAIVQPSNITNDTASSESVTLPNQAISDANTPAIVDEHLDQQEKAGRFFAYAVILSLFMMILPILYFFVIDPLIKELKAKAVMVKYTNVDIYDEDWDSLHNLAKTSDVTKQTTREISREWNSFCTLRQKILLHRGISGWRDANHRFRQYRFTLRKLTNMVDNDIAIANADKHN